MGTPTKKIIFTNDVRVLDHNSATVFEAKVGEVKELSASSANRWLKRNLATEDIKGHRSSTMKKAVEEVQEKKQDAPITAAEKEPERVEEEVVEPASVTKKRAPRGKV